MASGSITVNACLTDSGIVADVLEFSWWEISQSVADNTTTVGWKLDLIAYKYGRINSSASKKWSVTFAGQSYSGTNTIGISASSTKTLASGTTVVSHESDGTKPFTFSFSQEIKINFGASSTYIGTKSGSGTGTLTPIARASRPSLITYPENTQNVGDFGTTINVYMNSASPEFTHWVRYEFGSVSGTCIDADTGKEATAVVNSFRWTIPLSFMNEIPYTTSGPGRIYVDTYKGSTLIGTKYCGFTATVPSDIKPTCSCILEDVTGIDDIYGSPVKGLSKIKFVVSETHAYGSPNKTPSVIIDGVTYSAYYATTGYLVNSGTSKVTVTITDGRGRSGTWSYNMTVKDYAKPAITKMAVARCNQYGTSNKRGAYLKVTFSAVVSSLDSKNTASYSIMYKKTADSSYTTVPLTALANNYAPTNATYIFDVSANSYDVILSVRDSHNSSSPITKSAKAPAASAIFSWRGFKNKTTGAIEDGAGIGKTPEKPNTLQVGWKAEFEDDVTLNGGALYGPHGMPDTRDTNETPEWYLTTVKRGVIWEFKRLSSIGFISPAADFAPVQTMVPWYDPTGGLPRQVAYENGTRWTRIASSVTTWGPWVKEFEAEDAFPPKVLFEENYEVKETEGTVLTNTLSRADVLTYARNSTITLVVDNEEHAPDVFQLSHTEYDGSHMEFSHLGDNGFTFITIGVAADGVLTVRSITTK